MPENTQFQKVKDITDQLEAGIQDLFNSEKYMTWLRTMSKFHDYSLNNTLLIAFQKPEATLVAGYTSWQKQFGRQVLKGERGIKILAPTPYKRKIETDKLDDSTHEPVIDENGVPIKEVTEVLVPAFKVVNVFDVSQTEGRELPTIGADELSGDVQQYDVFFEALKRTSPVPIAFETIPGEAKGYYHQLEKRIAIQEGMSQVQTIKTAIHEIAHSKLHDADHPEVDPVWKIVMVSDGGTKYDYRLGFTSEEEAENAAAEDDWRFVDENQFEWRLEVEEDNTPVLEAKKNRQTKEVEAESIAYTVCQHYGIETSDYSFAYIAGWSKNKGTPELKASLSTIRITASEMINQIDGHVKELQKARPLEENLYVVGPDHYLDIHLSHDGAWDYSIYDKTFLLIDGGRFSDDHSLALEEARDEILKLHDLPKGELRKFPRNSFEEFRDVVFANSEFSEAQRDYLGDLILDGVDVREFWVGGKTIDLTERTLQDHDIAEIKYRTTIDAIPRMLFSKEQWDVIADGISERLDVQLIADPQYEPEQMKALLMALRSERQGVISREEVLSLASPYFSAEAMLDIHREMWRSHQTEIAEAEQLRVSNAGLQTNGLYRYYSTQRPVGPGTFPKENNPPVNIENYHSRIHVEGGSTLAWGYIEYAKPLSDKQISDYELKPALGFPVVSQEHHVSLPETGHGKKSVLEDLRRKQLQISRGKEPSTLSARRQCKENKQL